MEVEAGVMPGTMRGMVARRDVARVICILNKGEDLIESLLWVGEVVWRGMSREVCGDSGLFIFGNNRVSCLGIR